MTSNYALCNAISFCICFVFVSTLILAPNFIINPVFADGIPAFTSEQEGTIKVGTEPFGVAVNPNTNKVYVANWSPSRTGLTNATISVIDGWTNRVIDTIVIGEVPSPEVVVNPNTNRIYISAAPQHTPTPYNLTVIDGSTNRIIHTLPVTGALDINTNTNTVYLVETGSYPHGRFHVIDGSTDKIVTSFNLDTPNLPSWVAVDANTNRVYVTLGKSLAIIDSSTNQVLAANVTSICPPEMNRWGCYETALAVNPATNKLYVSSISVGPESMAPPLPPSTINATLYVLDGSTYKVLTSFTLPYPTGIAINPNSSRVYVFSGYNNKVTVIDGSSQDTIIDMINVIEKNDNKWFWVAGKIALNSHTNTIYVTNTPFNSVSIIDGATNKVIPEFPLAELFAFTTGIILVIVMFTRTQKPIRNQSK